MKYDVTIGIPTYNRATCLHRAIDSALSQIDVNVEVIVSDNGSDDNTSAVARKYADRPSFRYYKKLFNMGPSANYNECLNKATGTYFMILGDDDWLSQDYCKLLIRSLNGEDAVFLGKCQTVAPDGMFLSQSSDIPFQMDGFQFFGDLLSGKKNVGRHACFMLAAKTESMRKVGGFPSTEAGQHCDNMLLAKLLLTRKILYDPVPVNYYSVYPESYGNSNIPSVAIASLQYFHFWEKFIDPFLESSQHNQSRRELKKNLIYSLTITYVYRVLKYGNGWKEKRRLIFAFPRWDWLVAVFFRFFFLKIYQNRS